MNNRSEKSTGNAHVFDAKQQKMLQQVSEDFPSKLNHFRKAYEGSLRSAIIAKCLECVWGSTAAIRECTATGCPLYAQRPYQIARSSNSEKANALSAEAEVSNEQNFMD